MNGTDHAFKFRNEKFFNQTVDTIDVSESSLEDLDADTSTSESSSFATERPNWKQSFENSLDSVFNRQKRFANSSDVDNSDQRDDFDVLGQCHTISLKIILTFKTLRVFHLTRWKYFYTNKNFIRSKTRLRLTK